MILYNKSNKLSNSVHYLRNYSNLSYDPNHKAINFGAISGFIDGEGSFNLSIYKDTSINTGWRVKLIFKIALHERDIGILELIKNLLKVGNITKHGPQSIQFRVSSLNDLEVLINFLDKYPLITQKYGDYLLFKKALLLMRKKEHLSAKGLLKFVAIKASMNLGISSELRSAFPDTIADNRLNAFPQNIDPNWMRGFSSDPPTPSGWAGLIDVKLQIWFGIKNT